ncbi:hypothetical protein ACOSOMT5_P2087 [Acidiphilium sp. MT5]
MKNPNLIAGLASDFGEKLFGSANYLVEQRGACRRRIAQLTTTNRIDLLAIHRLT